MDICTRARRKVRHQDVARHPQEAARALPLQRHPFECYRDRVKVFLDDERETPPGWVRARWPDEVIKLLETGGVTELSLDHDLGDDARGTGYDVIRWIEEAVAVREFVPPAIRVHSANSSARERMVLGIESIKRLAGKS